MHNQRTIALGLIGAAALAIAVWWISNRDTPPSAQNPPPSNKNPLVQDQRAGVLYQLDKKTQTELIASVRHFCVETYHKESCVQHLITCGNPCVVVIPKNLRTRIFNDYQMLRKAQGLPMLLKLPPKPDDD